MARRRREVRTIELDGRDVVVLDLQTYEALEASRRQVGALQTQLGRLTADLARAREGATPVAEGSGLSRWRHAVRRARSGRTVLLSRPAAGPRRRRRGR